MLDQSTTRLESSSYQVPIIRRWNTWTVCLLIGSFVPIPVQPITLVTCDPPKTAVKSPALLAQKDRKTGTLDFYPARVMKRLESFEAHEANLHLKQDYRQAWITVSFALRGIPDAFVQSSYACYGVHPDKVWPSIVSDRKARLGAEYHDWYDSADMPRPDVPKLPPRPADTHAANGADLPTGTGRVGSVPTERKTV